MQLKRSTPIRLRRVISITLRAVGPFSVKWSRRFMTDAAQFQITPKDIAVRV